MRKMQLSTLTVVPLFPQYASCTVGSVQQKVMETLERWETIPELRFVSHFYDNHRVIRAFAENGRRHKPEQFDHILFSFHGIPQRQLLKGDDSGAHCLQSSTCCSAITDRNKLCYSAQCHETARLIAAELDLPEDRYTISFQSRLGSDPWTQPYTSEVIKRLAHDGAKRVLVFCPAFVSDCLETLYEIAEENNEDFQEAGGDKVELVESLNDSKMWVDALAEIVTKAEPQRSSA
jgi:ferrochelatase